MPFGMWSLPRPGIEPVSFALAGGWLTSGPPGKPCFLVKMILQGLRRPSTGVFRLLVGPSLGARDPECLPPARVHAGPC